MSLSTNDVAEAILRREDTTPRGRRRISRNRFIGHYLPAYALPTVALLVAVFFSVWPKTSRTFLTTANAQVLLSSQVVPAIIALGALIPLIASEWDLSVGAISGIAGVSAAQLLAHHVAGLLTVLIVLLIGVVIGATNALIVTRIRVNAVITTLGMATILDGLINQRTGGTTILGYMPTWITDFGTTNWFGIPRTVYAVVLVAAIVYYLTDHTPYGRQLYALGSNPVAATLVGIRTRVILLAAFAIAGLLSAFGGFLEVAQAGSGNPHVGDTFTLPALAAAFLSAASIRPGKYNVGGALAALVFLGVINSGLNLAGAPTYLSSYVNGAALILGVALAAWLSRRGGAASA